CARVPGTGAMDYW
nr:immunoglobulin heavy chain junction region [Mus musculus]